MPVPIFKILAPEAIQWKKDSLFNTCRWDSWTSTCKKIILDRDLIPSTKINSKFIIDPNVKCKTIKLLKDNTGENLDDLEF